MYISIVYLDIPNLKTVSLSGSFEKVKTKTISSFFINLIKYRRCFIGSL